MASVQWYIEYWKSRAVSREGDENKKRIGATRAALLETELQKATGHLIERAQVVAVMSSAYTRLGKALNSLPSSLGRELNWAPETTRVVRAAIDDLRQNFVRDSSEFQDVTDDQKPRKTGT